MRELWYFSADWCGPCRTLGPIMDQAASEGIKIKKLNVDYEADVSSKYNVRSIPTVILVENGQEVSRFVGAKDLGFIKRFYNG
jgi:thioredoxin